MMQEADQLEENMSESFLKRFSKWQDEFRAYLDILKSSDPETATAIENTLDMLFGEQTQENIEAALYMAQLSAAATRGFDFFVSEDGIHFDEISRDGFGDPYNYGVRVYGAQDTMENKWFVVGAANPFYGAQLWKLMDTPIIPKNFTIKFNMNGYGKQIPDQVVLGGNKAIKPADPAAEGMKFYGWYKDPSCRNPWDFSTDVVMGNTVLYAKWVDVPATGDSEHPYLWAALLMASVVGIYVGMANGKKRRNER